jgi:DnaK suppressor protein
MAVDEVRDRIEKELGSVMERLRQLGGAVVVEEFPGAVGDNSPFADPTEEVQVQGEREVSFATRSLLVERANRLAEALERLREGEYGTCEECGEAIAPARLKAMPEVTTCVRCQDNLERLARRLETVGAGLEAEELEEE